MFGFYIGLIVCVVGVFVRLYYRSQYYKFAADKALPDRKRQELREFYVTRARIGYYIVAVGIFVALLSLFV